MSATEQILAALRQTPGITSREIFDRCDEIDDPATVSALLKGLFDRGTVTRIGSASKYLYRLGDGKAPAPTPTKIGTLQNPPAKREAAMGGDPHGSDPERLRCLIDDDGALTIVLPARDGGDQINLAPAETQALGDFLACTEKLWSGRP